MQTAPQTWITDLVHQLDYAVGVEDVEARCKQIARILQQHITGAESKLSPQLLRSSVDDYARRLLHRDPNGRYSVVLMVWGAGQISPLHDHAGKWCVECVHSGEIEVQSFEPTDGAERLAEVGGDCDGDVVQFRHLDTIRAEVGRADIFVPPVEYHVLHNPHSEFAATVHVYSGELEHCRVFIPTETGYLVQTQKLSYSD